MIGVELASMLLLAGWWVHITWASAKTKKTEKLEVQHDRATDEGRALLAGIFSRWELDGSTRAT